MPLMGMSPLTGRFSSRVSEGLRRSKHGVALRDPHIIQELQLLHYYDRSFTGYDI